MLTQRLEFELNYDPVSCKLTMIDFNSPAKDDKPVRLSFTNVKDVEGIKTAVGAWITLKEDNEKNNCKNENG